MEVVSDSIAAKRALEAAYDGAKATHKALEAWNRLTGRDDRPPLSEMREALDQDFPLTKRIAYLERVLHPHETPRFNVKSEY
jgi:hypothetical protein